MVGDGFEKALEFGGRLKKAADFAPGIDRALKVFDIRVCRVCWDETENPLYVWDAYQICREIEYDLPSWVLEYFDRSVKNVFNLNYEGDKIREKFYGAMCMQTTGQGVTPWEDYAKFKLKIKAVCRVVTLKEDNPQRNYEDIYNDVKNEFAKDGYYYSCKTIKNWSTKRMKEIVNKPPR
jgi:hypothetical protein